MMVAAARLLTVLPAVAILGWAGATAVDVIRADGLVREAATEMASWAAARVDPALETWTSAHASLEAGLRIRPMDPSSHELLGLLETMRREDHGRMVEGIGHLVTALEQRPVSPYTWGNLLEVRYRAGDPAGSLELLLQRAVELGPSEPGVQRLVVDYGLALWPEIGPDARRQVDRMLAAGIRRNPLEMLRISDRRGRLEAACSHVFRAQIRDPRAGRACEQWEITP